MNGSDPSGQLESGEAQLCSGGGTLPAGESRAQACAITEQQEKAISSQECANGGDCGSDSCGTWAIDCWYPVLPLAGLACALGGCETAGSAAGGTALGTWFLSLFGDSNGPEDSEGATCPLLNVAAQTATADISKFSNYAFVVDKAPVFESYGYTAADSQDLADLYEEQAAQKFADGDYTVGKLDQYGQRVTIEIDLPGQGGSAGRSTVLNSGWMIEPDGSIRLLTPFAGFAK